MRKRDTRDFPDVILQALDIVRAHGRSEYRAAIVDEAQDLTLAGLNLVRSLVNGSGDDPSDGLLLVGDGAQRIYPSCYTLRQAGLEVRGRTTILKRNYRNARPILAAALAVAGDRTVDDLGDEFKRGDAETISELEGARPRILVCHDLDDQWDQIALEIKRAVETSAVGYGDVGILLPTNRFAFGGEKRLRERGLPVLNLKDFAGQTTDEIRIGTYFRAKGLEFKMVVLPDVSQGRLPSPQRRNENDDAYQERLDLEMSAFYVAMSRARDQLLITLQRATRGGHRAGFRPLRREFDPICGVCQLIQRRGRRSSTRRRDLMTTVETGLNRMSSKRQSRPKPSWVASDGRSGTLTDRGSQVDRSSTAMAPRSTRAALPAPAPSPVHTATAPKPRRSASVAPAQVPPESRSLATTSVT